MAIRGGTAAGTWRLRIGASLLCALALLLGAERADAFIYWTDEGNDAIGRAALDGSSIEPSAVGQAYSACGLAAGEQALYWAVGPLGTIATANLDGSGVDQALLGAGVNPCGVSVSGEALAWTSSPGSGNASGGAIGIGSADGAFDTDYWLFGLPAVSHPRGTASHNPGAGGSIYWTNDDGSVWATPAGTQAPRQLFPPSSGASTAGIAVSSAGIYWLGPFGNLLRANLDGSGATSLASGITGACGVAVDQTYVYWVNRGSRTIGRMHLDGSNQQPSFIDLSTIEGDDGPVQPCWLAVNEDTALASASPRTIDFGELLTGSGPSAPQTVTLTNSSSTSVSLVPGAGTLIGPSADRFAITGNTCGAAVAPGASCAITLQFSPTSLGGHYATLVIPTNDPSNPEIDVTLLGTGTDPHQTVSPASIAFGHQLVGTASPARTVTLTNGPGASAPDAIGQATLIGPGASRYEILSDGCSNTTVAIGASCQIALRFAPTATGDAAAALMIPSDDPTSPATVGLSGLGTAPDPSIAPASLGFGSQQVGTSSPTRTIEVDNSAAGTGPLVLGSVSVGGSSPSGFQVVFDNCSEQTLSPGEECHLGVRFAPSVAGAQAATTLIPSSAASAPLAVQLAGDGVAAVPALPATRAPDPRCQRIRATLKRTSSKKKRRVFRKRLRRLGC